MDTKVAVTGTIRGTNAGKATLLVDHQCPLKEFDERGLYISLSLEKCGIRGFFLEPLTIFPELIINFWDNSKVLPNFSITSRVLGKEVILNQSGISEAIGCGRVPNCYYLEWESIYNGTGVLEQQFYGENYSDDLVGKKVKYKKLCPKAKIWQQLCNKCLLPKSSSKDHITEYGIFVIYHLLAELPFNLPRLLYLNLLRMLKTVGEGMNNIPYSAPINRVLEHQGVLDEFNKLSKKEKEGILNKGGWVVRQPLFSIVNMNKMHLNIDLEKVAVSEFPLDYLMAYRLDNQEPAHLGEFESFSSIEEKVLKMMSSSLKRKEDEPAVAQEKFPDEAVDDTVPLAVYKKQRYQPPRGSLKRKGVESSEASKPRKRELYELLR